MNKNLRRINPTEHQIQAAIVEWANLTYIERYGQKNNGGLFVVKRKVGDFLLAIPNGGYRNKREAAKLKKEGVKKGISDLFFAYPQFGRGFFCHGLWIEIKKKGGRLSDNQVRWFALMNLQGYETKLIDTVEKGIQAIKDYLGMK